MSRCDNVISQLLMSYTHQFYQNSFTDIPNRHNKAENLRCCRIVHTHGVTGNLGEKSYLNILVL